MVHENDVLISLKPRHANEVFGGTKSVELRKRLLRLSPGTRVWIYAKAPVAEIKGYAHLAQIDSASPSNIWKTWGNRTGISREEFDLYFAECHIAHALVLRDVMLMNRALPLARIRKLVRGFHPPQFYCRLNGAKYEMRLPRRKHRHIKVKSD